MPRVVRNSERPCNDCDSRLSVGRLDPQDSNGFSMSVRSASSTSAWAARRRPGRRPRSRQRQRRRSRRVFRFLSTVFFRSSGKRAHFLATPLWTQLSLGCSTPRDAPTNVGALLGVIERACCLARGGCSGRRTMSSLPGYHLAGTLPRTAA